MARLRLGYTKSRNGCLRCKQRRVKCDENRPCTACVRHNVDCSLVTSSLSERCETPPRQAQTKSKSASPVLERPIRPLAWKAPVDQPGTPHPLLSPPTPTQCQLPASPEQFPYFSKFITGHPHDDTENWVSDLELLHHFTTSTSKSMFISKGMPTVAQNVWEVDVPKLGFRHVFLLHQLLATAAFHQAYLHPENYQRYSLQASQHQSVAIQGARAALSNITADNCDALFAASSLFFIGALAASRPNPHSPHGPTIEDLVDIFLLVKGVGGVLDSAEAALRQGPFSRLFHPTRSNDTPPSVTLNRLTEHLKMVKFRERISELPDGKHRAIIEGEVSNLEICMEKATSFSATPEYRTMASWPIFMSDSYVTLLRQRDQAALALLSYYCVVIFATEKDYWFTRGWSYSIIQDITRSMAGPWDGDSAWAYGWIMGHNET
ncbi:hypothetical protein OQA88_8740 [Cercophora sp. LCS_1]